MKQISVYLYEDEFEELEAARGGASRSDWLVQQLREALGLPPRARKRGRPSDTHRAPRADELALAGGGNPLTRGGELQSTRIVENPFGVEQ